MSHFFHHSCLLACRNENPTWPAAVVYRSGSIDPLVQPPHAQVSPSLVQILRTACTTPNIRQDLCAWVFFGTCMWKIGGGRVCAQSGYGMTRATEPESRAYGSPSSFSPLAPRAIDLSFAFVFFINTRVHKQPDPLIAGPVRSAQPMGSASEPLVIFPGYF